MKRNILQNHIVYIDNLESFNDFNECQDDRIKIGKFIGPDYYVVLQYSKPCPRGCCSDHVFEILTKEEYIRELKDKIKTYCDALKEIRELKMREDK